MGTLITNIKRFIKIGVTFFLSVVAVVLYKTTIFVALLIHGLTARKAIKKMEGSETQLQKYKMIVNPFILINGLVFIVTSSICFRFFLDKDMGVAYFYTLGLLVLGVFMVTKYSLNIPYRNDSKINNFFASFGKHDSRRKNILHKAFISSVSVIMCAVMIMQISYHDGIPDINNTTLSQDITEDAAKKDTAFLENDEDSALKETSSADSENEFEPAAGSSNPIDPPDLSNSSGSSDLTQSETQESHEIADTAYPASEAQEPPSVPVISYDNNVSNTTTSSNSQTEFNQYNNPEQQNTTSYVLNTSSKKFHKPSCSDVKRIKSSNYSTVNSRGDAINRGYVPCKRCNP